MEAIDGVPKTLVRRRLDGQGPHQTLHSSDINDDQIAMEVISDGTPKALTRKEGSPRVQVHSSRISAEVYSDGVHTESVYTDPEAGL